MWCNAMNRAVIFFETAVPFTALQLLYQIFLVRAPKIFSNKF